MVSKKRIRVGRPVTESVEVQVARKTGYLKGLAEGQATIANTPSGLRAVKDSPKDRVDRDKYRVEVYSEYLPSRRLYRINMEVYSRPGNSTEGQRPIDWVTEGHYTYEQMRESYDYVLRGLGQSLCDLPRFIDWSEIIYEVCTCILRATLPSTLGSSTVLKVFDQIMQGAECSNEEKEFYMGIITARLAQDTEK